MKTYEWPDAAWKRLVLRYASGREPCNCAHAYYSYTGTGLVTLPDGRHEKRTDMRCCEYGCAANLISAKQEIGQMVEAELEALSRNHE